MDERTKQFYDELWPKNIPCYEETKKYMLNTILERSVGSALDAGCGHGVCSLVLSEIADQVTALDLGERCIATATGLANQHGRINITFAVADLQELSLPEASYDLVWCWGVAMMAPDPERVFAALFRVLRRGGVIYLGVYLKTWLWPLHELLRHFFRTFMNGPRRKRLVLDFFAFLTRTIVFLRGREINLRPDNVSIQTQVDDWYYAPYKTFYTPTEIIRRMHAAGIEGCLVQSQVGRMKSATIFVVRGVKNGATTN